MTNNGAMSDSIISKQPSRFIELDGLRALAVFSVILFHCEISGLADAGFFGVDIFFAISGFIITAMLLKQHREDGKLDFVNFYFRRLKRLMPPVLVLIVVAYLVTAKMSQEALAVMLRDLPAALFFWSNWWQILDHQDYFDTTPRVLKHLWSLAVEEQFYFVWPPVAYVLLRWRGERATGVVALSLALLSTGWMAWLYANGADSVNQNRLYLGTHTHAMGLLIGAALGCFWNPWSVPAEPRPRHELRFLAVAALAALVYLIQTANTEHPSLYQGLFLLVPVLTCVVIFVTVSQSACFLSKVLRAPFVQWMGSRSYSLYLVHWPVFVWMRLQGHDDFSNWRVLLISLSIVAILAELLYRAVEANAGMFDHKNPDALAKVLAILAYAVIAALIEFAALYEIDQRATRLAEAGSKTNGPVIPAIVPASSPSLPVGPGNVVVVAGAPISGGGDMYAIGDSVLLGARQHLSKAIPGIRIDARVGRQASEGSSTIKEWRNSNAKATTVLVHLGTNGYINESQYRKLLAELSDCQSVILINVRAKRRWTAPNNEIIGRMAREFLNVRVIDWNALSDNHPEFFVKDGIHLTQKGIVALTERIKLMTGGKPLSPDDARERILASTSQARIADAPRLASRLALPAQKPELAPMVADPAVADGLVGTPAATILPPARPVEAMRPEPDVRAVQHDNAQAASEAGASPMEAQEIK
jgi:peptidoglycan/LPS O-acetylase OafA/YrhL